MKVTDKVVMLSGIGVNQYLIIEPDGLTLIDTGMAGNGRKVLRAISELGEKPERVRHILITHADADHYGAINELLKVCPADVQAGEGEAGAIRGGSSSRALKPKGLFRLLFALLSPLLKAPPSRVDEVLKVGQILPILGGLQVLDTKGHTPGHLSFYAPSEGVLFSGDSIQGRNNVPSPSSGANTWDLDAATRSFDLQMALHPAYICGGHGFYRVAQETMNG